ncbi:DUF502 domain-containing protein [Hyphococcus luteus]|uniref:DUF502 domain-containing protein n=1 Tax=Hyphococcus luteus TaxID=2058213 RepID=A0A2S7K2L9_9PROT|nr:DUF502 domain-containing protein [Marinicaulis flavus]PQA86743.1 hypothetical protein CW354_14735 [Marinicaulis flavus]
MSDEQETHTDEPHHRRGGLGGEGPLIQPKKQSFLGGLWSDFLAGVAVVAPTGITIWLFYLLFTGPMAKLDTFVKRTLPVGDSKYETFVQFFPGFGVFLAFIAIILIGIFTKNFIGRSFIRAGERLFESLPIVRNVFGFFKNVFETALRQSDRSFKEVALVEYPRKGAWVMAFVVGETKGEVLTRLDDMGDHLTSIFIPTVPNPTSGFLLFVPRKDLRVLSMTVEEAAKVVFSLGLVTPDYADGAEAAKRLEKLAKEANGEKTLKKRLFGGRKS